MNAQSAPPITDMAEQGLNAACDQPAVPSATAAPLPPEVALVLPLHNEAENILALTEAIRIAMASPDGFAAAARHTAPPYGRPDGPPAGKGQDARPPRYEIILVDDGSLDGTGAIIEKLASEIAEVRALHHPQAAGQSAAVHTGVMAAQAPLIATLDGDGQNPPENLPKLIAPLLDDWRRGPAADAGPLAPLGLVAGQRVGRQDSWSKRLGSSVANHLRRSLLRDGTRDTGCGLKAFRRDAYLALPYFNHQHRFLPALFARDGWRIAHVDVSHSARTAGQSKYTNLGRALVGIPDLLGVWWLIRRAKSVPPAAMIYEKAVKK